MNGGTNPNGTGGNPENPDNGTGREKVSQFFSNTLTKREGESVGDPLTYLTKTEAETLENAVRRMKSDPDGEMALLASTTMWTDEQVKMAKVLGSNLFAEGQKSGDMTAYNAFRKVEREHATAIARALRAYGQDPDTELSAESVARMAERFFSLVEDGAVPEVGTMTPEQIETAKKQVTETTSELAQLEAREKESRDSGMSEEEAWEKVKEDYLNAAQRLVAQRNVGMLIDNLAGKNKALRKGAENVTTALRRFLASESPDYIKRYVYANAAGISSDLKYKGSFTLDKGAKWISSMQKLCQLFGSSTTLRNLEGNTGAGAIAFLSNNGAKVAADQLIGLFSGNRTASFEKGVFSKGNWGESWKAVRRSILEISANMDMGGKYTTTGTSAFNPYNSVDRLFNRANQILSYALNTSDAGFVGMAQASAADAALRGSKRSGGKMTEETAQKIGRNEAEYQTFKNDTAVQKGLEAARNFLDLLGVGGKVQRKKGVPVGRSGGFGLGTAVAPYIQVPVNIALKGVEYSPIGAVKGMADAGKAIKAAKNSKPDTKAGQEAMILQNKAAGEIGRGITGTALVMLLAHLMKKAKEEDKEWFRDWNLESDPNVRAQNKAEGKSGQQINMTRFRQLVRGEDFSGKWDNGDELVNISSIEPLNQYIGIASMLADDDGQYSAADYLTALYTSTRDSIEDISAISSINQFADTFKYNKVYRTTIEEDEEGNQIENREADTLATAAQATGAMLGNAASGFIPAPVRHAAQFGDEYQRETRGEKAMQTAWNQVLSSIPGARETLPVKTDNFGRKMTQGDRSTRFKNTYGPNKHTQLDQSDVSREMEAIRDATDQVLLPDRMGPSSIKIGSKTVYPTVRERNEWGDENGSNTERAMQLAMRNPVYRNADYKTRAEMVKEYEKYIRDGMKEDYAREHGIEFESKYEAARSMDNPISYLTSKKQFSLAEKGGDWDVVDTLIGPLENMTAADQERSREREGDRSMWSFFDFLTTNPEGYKASSAQAVHDYKEGAKARAAARGVQSAGSKDRLQEIKSGLVSGKYSSADADAFFSKQQSDGDWELSKGYYAIYAAARAAGATPLEAIAAIEGADRDGNGTLDEYGYRKKAKYEVSRAVKGGGFDMSEFDRVYNKK